MIRVEELLIDEVATMLFILETDNTGYIIKTDKSGNLVHLYYGEKLGLESVENSQLVDLLKAMTQKKYNQNGCAIIQDKAMPDQSLDDVCLEISSRGKGDFREPFVELKYADGSTTSDFRFDSYRLSVEKEMPDNMPGAYFEKEENTEENTNLTITLKDKNSDAWLEINYAVFAKCNCITRFARVINKGNDEIIVKRLMSSQLDMSANELKIVSFHGDWAREMNRFDTLLQAGKYVSDSSTGFTSNKANPFIIFGSADITEESGNCYATNLIYSGNHRECVEAGGQMKMRALTGINPDFFEWKLAAKTDDSEETFCSPEAVMTYSATGYQGISENMHSFVREHIVRGKWKKKVRPILLNSWEAAYFDISERRILKLAKAAVDAGIELFVLDDGWFGKRNDDSSSLGDWYDNTEKLPNGLRGISEKIQAMGLKFGIWVEPEMISEDSDLYRAHPDWAVTIPNKEHSLGRNQMLLDLTRKEVQDYIIDSMSDVFNRSQATYVKWDMNRHMSDLYSKGDYSSSEFSHRYILGLYSVLQELTNRFPNTLFEACASGGNRFDLGMLSYMSQVWASDNTDAISRGTIQNGYSYGYPQSVMGAHVSGCPNHQTLRITPLTTRFAISCAGVLGYECNLCDLKADELAEIKEQIILYKKWRSILQFGQFYRLNENVSYGSNHYKKIYDTNVIKWEIVSEDKKNAVGITMQGMVLPNYSHHRFQTKKLDENMTYHFYNRTLKYDIHRMGDLINTMAPAHIKQDSLVHDVISKFVKLDGEIEDYRLSGAVLNKFGVELAQSYAGTGFNPNTAIYQDYDARVYFIEAE